MCSRASRRMRSISAVNSPAISLGSLARPPVPCGRAREPNEMAGEFTADIERIRREAREHIEQGAITNTYGADRERVVDVLNTVLATELVCVLRYKRHYY